MRLVLYGALLLFGLRFLGKNGLITFAMIAFLGGNLQVLHQAQFSFLDEPVALGTILFSFTYLTSDILTEHFGAKIARQSVLMSILAQVLFAIIMMSTLFHHPLPHIPENQNIYEGFKLLFLPMPRFLIASLLAYGISQLLDIWVFQRLKIITEGKFLWLRLSASTLIGGLVDQIIFSVLAWVVLAPTPVTLSTLFWTYIVGSYAGRALVSVVGFPLMYISKCCIPSEKSSV